MEKKIREIVGTILGVDAQAVSESVDLRSYGLDSIRYIQMVIALEDSFQRRIPVELYTLEELNTIRQIKNVVGEQSCELQ